MRRAAPAIRAVISDFGGVLTSPLSEAFAAYHEHSGIPVDWLRLGLEGATTAYGEHPLFELECGRISEYEFLRRIEESLPEPRRLEGFREVYFQYLIPNELMLEHLRDLRARGLRLGLLTNNVREWEPLWRAKIPDVEALFEVVVDSAFVGMRKPDHGIYELTLKHLGGGLTAQQCLFVDDLEVNCDAARALGMSAVRFVDSAQAIAEIETLLSGRGQDATSASSSAEPTPRPP